MLLVLKELWEINEENFDDGLVEHSMGWPLSDETKGWVIPLSF